MDNRKKILLVDDVRLFLEMEKSFLNRTQVEFAVARSGREALNVLPVLRPQLVIMDQKMPEMDGVEACRRIKADPEYLDLPVVLVAASEQLADIEECRTAGCDAVVAKPLDRRELLLVAQRFLELSERAAPRVKTRMLVRYGVERQLSLHDFSANLAPGGLFLEASRILPVETELTLEFFVPGTPDPLRCEGRVVWVNRPGAKAKPDLPSGFGVRFEHLDAREARVIKAFIHGEFS